VVFTPSYHRLRQAVCKHGAVHDGGLAVMAGLTAKVKNNATDNTVAEQMATGKGDSARVSGLRFRRLLKVKDQEELFTAFGRIIALLGESVNLQSMAQSVYFWNDITRKQWAFDYYSKAPSEK
jgi:CRISPR system Cascade subunit CasB